METWRGRLVREYRGRPARGAGRTDAAKMAAELAGRMPAPRQKSVHTHVLGCAMAKRCETFDHTADVGLAATADTLGELYEALAEGLTDVVCRRAEVKAAAVRPLRVAAEDREALAVDFLAAALNVMQTDHFLVAAVRVRRADERSLEAELHGERYDPTRHELKTEVKAVTYHQLKVARDAGRWTARVILDL